MKLSNSPLPFRRRSVARILFTLAACASAAAVALAAPQRTTVGSMLNAAVEELQAVPEDATASDAQPPSMSKTVQVMVEMEAPPAATVFAEALQAAQAREDALKVQQTGIPLSAAQKGALPRVEIDAAATSRVQSHIVTLDAQQQALLPALTNVGADVIFRTQRAYNGIAIKVSPDRISEIAKLPGVKSVRTMTPKYPTAFSDIDFLGTRGTGFWNKAYERGVGIHGEGVKVGVIDTGLDYTHTNFGGPGTPNYAGITDKTPVPNEFYPTSKVPFGFDFAGDNYSASGEPGTSEVPSPDDNPLDRNGHGTSCASLVAGFGINAGGSTYVGNYDDTTPIGALKISPGFAPQAQIIPLRVFGAQGSTNLTTQAVDFAIDPNGDGNFNDRLDIISLSLGSNNGTADDETAIACANAVAAGVVVIASAGNAGDTYYITGSPGTGTGVISTAASYNDQAGYIYNLNILVNLPESLRGSRSFAIYGNVSPRAGDNATLDVVAARPNEGCTAFTNANFVSGKIALIDRGTCSFSQKIQNAQAAGAAGVIVVQNAGDPFVMSVPGTSIPSAMISKSDGDAFKAAAAFDPATGLAANGANVSVFNDNGVVDRAGISADTMPSYSSRGPRLNDNALKPDLTAPAEVVGVARTGTGTDVSLFNGTSSACPHVSGGMALLKQLHPTWTVEELTTLMVNTATSNLFQESGATGNSGPSATRRGVSRVGSGRVDFAKLSRGNVIVLNGSKPGSPSFSFGSVEVPVDGQVDLTQKVVIRNKGSEAVTYNLSLDMVNTVGDARFSAPQPQVTVPANSEISFPLLFQATGSSLTHTKDPSVAPTQGVLGGNLPRTFLSEAAGYGVLTPTSGDEPTIRVALYAAPKPVSSMRANPSFITPAENTFAFDVRLDGAGVTNATSVSLSKPLELQYTHPEAGNPGFSNDPNVIKYVGVTSDYVNRVNKQDTRLTFAIDGFGNATVPSFISSDREIFIDVNFDGTEDFVIFLNSRRISGTTTHSNVYTPSLLNLNTGQQFALGTATNGFLARDTNSFNNSVVLVTVPASLLGYTGTGQSNFNYQVATFNRSGDFVDATPVLTFDIARPGLDGTPRDADLATVISFTNPATEPFFYTDLPGVEAKIFFDGNNFTANRSQGVMMVHMFNVEGAHTSVVAVRAPKIFSFSPTFGPVGTDIRIAGENFTSATAVVFSPNVTAPTRLVSANTLLATVPQGATTGPISVRGPAGSSTSDEVFTVTTGPEPSPSPSPSPTASPTGVVRVRGSR